MKKTKWMAAPLALSLSLALTGCTPPMPPEVLAALAENTYTCESGEASLALPQAVADLGIMWQDSLATACTDMTLSLVEEGASADLELSATGEFTAECKPFSTVPFALDAGVMAINLPELGELFVTPQVAEKILSGQITSWDDSELAKLNPDYEMPAMEIQVQPIAQKNALDAFSEWMTRLGGHNFNHDLVEAGLALTIDEASALPEGGVAILPYSQSTQAMFLNATILTKGENRDFAVMADLGQITSAGTQFTAKSESGSAVATLKPDAKPIAPDGLDAAPLPYQGAFVSYLALCGEDTLVKRAMARFLLRQDSQGMLGASNMLNIAEPVRVISLDVVSKGLTLPSVDPADFEQ
jgi:hypothetical protein